MYWRQQRQMRGPEWGQERRLLAETGEWELPLEAQYNGSSITISYLNLVDSVTGRGRVDQVIVKGRTIGLVGNVTDVARASMWGLLDVEGLREKPEATAELVLFLTGVHHEQIRRENEWVMNGGRGKLDIVAVKEDPVDAVEKTVADFQKAGRIGEEAARQMGLAISRARETEEIYDRTVEVEERVIELG